MVHNDYAWLCNAYIVITVNDKLDDNRQNWWSANNGKTLNQRRSKRVTSTMGRFTCISSLIRTSINIWFLDLKPQIQRNRACINFTTKQGSAIQVAGTSQNQTTSGVWNLCISFMERKYSSHLRANRRIEVNCNDKPGGVCVQCRNLRFLCFNITLQ